MRENAGRSNFSYQAGHRSTLRAVFVRLLLWGTNLHISSCEEVPQIYSKRLELSLWSARDRRTLQITNHCIKPKGSLSGRLLSPATSRPSYDIALNPSLQGRCVCVCVPVVDPKLPDKGLLKHHPSPSCMLLMWKKEHVYPLLLASGIRDHAFSLRSSGKTRTTTN